MQQLSAPPTLSCNLQHRQQQQQPEEVIQIDEEEQIDQQENAMEVDGEDAQNEVNKNVSFSQILE